MKIVDAVAGRIIFPESISPSIEGDSFRYLEYNCGGQWDRLMKFCFYVS